MIRFMIKFLLREKNPDFFVNEARLFFIDKINDDAIYKKNKDFIIAMTSFYIRHGKFTSVQVRALRRVLNG